MLSRMSSNRRVKRDDHEPEEVDDESMGDSEEEAETEFFERNTNEFKCKKGQEQYVYVSKNHLIIKKYLLQKKIFTLHTDAELLGGVQGRRVQWRGEAGLHGRGRAAGHAPHGVTVGKQNRTVTDREISKRKMSSEKYRYLHTINTFTSSGRLLPLFILLSLISIN